MTDFGQHTRSRTGSGRHSEQAEGATAMVTACEMKFDWFLQDANHAGDEESINTMRKLRDRLLDWAAYLGVFARAKGSLDHRVQRLPQYRDLILLALDMLNANLPTTDGSSATGSDDSSDDEIDQDNVEMNGIRTAINELDRLAIHLRQAATSSIDSRVQAFASKRAVEVASFEAKAIVSMNAMYPEAPETFRRILIKSMTERHTKLLYWRIHDEKLRVDRRRDQSRHDNSRMQRQPSSVPTHQLVPQVHETDLEPISKGPAQSQLSEGVSRLSGTVASEQDPHFDADRTEDRVPKRMRSGASTVLQTRAKFPSAPRFDDEDEPQKPCPFCRKRFDRNEFATTLWWRCHVNEDLLPFVCILSSCSERPAFASRSEWIEHMEKDHSEAFQWRETYAMDDSKGSCVLCCMEIVDEKGKQASVQVSALSASEYPRESIAQLRSDSKKVHETFQTGQKRLRFEISENTGDGAEARAARSETQSGTKYSHRETDSPPSSARKPIIDHIASHLQFLALLTVRLSTDNHEDGKVHEFNSSQALSSNESSGTRSTLKGLSEVSETEEDGPSEKKPETPIPLSRTQDSSSPLRRMPEYPIFLLQPLILAREYRHKLIGACVADPYHPLDAYSSVDGPWPRDLIPTIDPKEVEIDNFRDVVDGISNNHVSAVFEKIINAFFERFSTPLSIPVGSPP